jgi:1-aminocyclopropane-1-carboxylate deaminase/D-cysteine desulfhydrase-like pyridoxal-dependent ACC family enzyme
LTHPSHTIALERAPSIIDQAMVPTSSRPDADGYDPGMTLPELPRVALLGGPTPLHPLPRLSEALGGRAELWIKREDLGPLAFSGNKLRNLEFLLGAAIAAGADTIVTSGRRWSNHCRLTAAAGARLGLRVEIVVSGPVVEHSPNLELIRLLGATVHQARSDERGERETLVAQVTADAERSGRQVSVIPLGGSDATGAWGQVLGALEAYEQAAAHGFHADAIVLPSATGGTQAGLTVGSALAAARRTGHHGTAPTRVIGVAVAHPVAQLRPHVDELVAELRGMAGMAAGPDALAALEFDDTQLGAGYGVPTSASEEAASLLARSEGVLVDPVYTAKGLAGLIGLVRAGGLDGRSAIFWHGGGLPALFESLDSVG